MPNLNVSLVPDYVFDLYILYYTKSDFPTLPTASLIPEKCIAIILRVSRSNLFTGFLAFSNFFWMYPLDLLIYFLIGVTHSKLFLIVIFFISIFMIDYLSS